MPAKRRLSRTSQASNKKLKGDEGELRTLTSNRKRCGEALRTLILPNFEALEASERKEDEKEEEDDEGHTHREEQKTEDFQTSAPNSVRAKVNVLARVHAALKVKDSELHYNPVTGVFAGAWPLNVTASGKLLLAPPGVGKTRMAGAVIKQHLEAQEHVLVLCPNGNEKRWQEAVEAEAHQLFDEGCELVVVPDSSAYNRLRFGARLHKKTLVVIVCASVVGKGCYKAYTAIHRCEAMRLQTRNRWCVLRKMEQLFRELERTPGSTPHPTATGRFAVACGIDAWQHAQALGSAIKSQTYKRDPRIVGRLAAALSHAKSVPPATQFELATWGAEFDALLGDYPDFEHVPWGLVVMDKPLTSCVEVLRANKAQRAAVRDAFANMRCTKLLLSRAPHADNREAFKSLCLELLNVEADGQGLDASFSRALPQAEAALVREKVVDLLFNSVTVDLTRDPRVKSCVAHMRAFGRLDHFTLTPEARVDEPLSAELQPLKTDDQPYVEGLQACEPMTLIALAESAAARVQSDSAVSVIRDSGYLHQYHQVLTQQLHTLQSGGGGTYTPEMLLTHLTQLDDLKITVDRLSKRIAANRRALAVPPATTLQMYLATFGEKARADMQCAVCTDRPPAVDLLVTNCRHSFCATCLEAWRASGELRAENCPLCRERVLCVASCASGAHEPDPTSLSELTHKLTRQKFGAKVAWLERELQSTTCQRIVLVCWCEASAVFFAFALKRLTDWQIERSHHRSSQAKCITVLNGNEHGLAPDMPNVDWLIVTRPAHEGVNPCDWVFRFSRKTNVRITELRLSTEVQSEVWNEVGNEVGNEVRKESGFVKAEEPLPSAETL